jgi:hypothetical protein
VKPQLAVESIILISAELSPGRSHCVLSHVYMSRNISNSRATHDTLPWKVRNITFFHLILSFSVSLFLSSFPLLVPSELFCPCLFYSLLYFLLGKAVGLIR